MQGFKNSSQTLRQGLFVSTLFFSEFLVLFNIYNMKKLLLTNITGRGVRSYRFFPWKSYFYYLWLSQKMSGIFFAHFFLSIWNSLHIGGIDGTESITVYLP